jgi:hypothetical protein
MNNGDSFMIRVLLSEAEIIEMFVVFLCKELDVQPRLLILETYDAKDGINGLCLDSSEDEFIILVKEEGRDIGAILNTIAHEMVHVKQYMKENLGQLLDQYTTIPYHDRWWEKEAFTRSHNLVIQFAKTI